MCGALPPTHWKGCGIFPMILFASFLVCGFALQSISPMLSWCVFRLRSIAPVYFCAFFDCGRCPLCFLVCLFVSGRSLLCSLVVFCSLAVDVSCVLLCVCWSRPMSLVFLGAPLVRLFIFVSGRYLLCLVLCRNRFRLRLFCLWFCVVVDLSCASWCADFRDTPLGSQKAPLKIKQMKNRGWKVRERIPYIFAYLILV